MENSLIDTKSSNTGTFRPRKSIFAETASKRDQGQPHILINDQEFSQDQTCCGHALPQTQTLSIQKRKYSKDPRQNVVLGPNRLSTSSLPKKQDTNVKYSPQKTVLIQFPQKLLRTASTNKVTFAKGDSVVGRQNTTLNFLRGVNKENNEFRQTIIKKGVVSQFQNKKSYEYGVVQPVHSQMVRRTPPANYQQLSKVIVRDSPKTLEEIQKLSFLNQQLSKQFTLLDQQHKEMKSKVVEKQFVNQRLFLEKSINRIQNIFRKETAQALGKLDEIYHGVAFTGKNFYKTSSTMGTRSGTETEGTNFAPTFQGDFSEEEKQLHTPIKQVMKTSRFLELNKNEEETK